MPTPVALLLISAHFVKLLDREPADFFLHEQLCLNHRYFLGGS